MIQKRILHPDLYPRIEDGDALIGRLGKRYHPSDGLLAAVNVALLIERPLLLTGEPGCGKTDFAWAASNALGSILTEPPEHRELLQGYVRSDSLARDILYSYDSVRRFGDAHHGGPEGVKRASDPRNYIELQPLGIALASPHRRVVLIDEIDKAPRDLPNDLLRELDQITFEISEIPRDQAYEKEIFSHGIPLKRTMKRPMDKNGKRFPGPLVIITSNVERQLPDAFLRRCIFCHIEFPEHLLPDILADHFQGLEKEGWLLEDAAAIFELLRATPGLIKIPGTAELLDWVSSLTRVYCPIHVKSQIKQFTTVLEQDHRNPSWKDLPGLNCLIKLREDMDKLCPT